MDRWMDKWMDVWIGGWIDGSRTGSVLLWALGIIGVIRAPVSGQCGGAKR